MFIQLQCGCIGLLVKDENDYSQFYKMIDCRGSWNDIHFYKESEVLQYRRFRQLKDDEAKPIIQLLTQAIADGNRYEQVQLSLGIENSHSQSQRSDYRKHLDDAFAKHRTMKSIDEIDIPKVFPIDKRSKEERDKETDRLKRLKAFDNNNS